MKHSKIEVFDANTGKGNQRIVTDKRRNVLKGVILEGKYTPREWKLSTTEFHRKNFVFKGGNVSFEVDETNPLLLIDGNTTTSALEDISTENETMSKTVKETDLPCLILLDGDPAEDFVNSQLSSAVSRDHMHSIRVANNLIDPKYAEHTKMGLAIAKLLHTKNDSFCKNLIGLDTKSAARFSLSSSTLCSKSVSELMFNLFGSAKIAVRHGKTAEWAYERIIQVHDLLKSEGLLEQGKVLCPLQDGTKVGTALVIAVANTLMDRLRLLGLDEAGQEDLDLLVVTASEYLDEPMPDMRKNRKFKHDLYHDFAVAYYLDILNDGVGEADEDGVEVPSKMFGSHHGIPASSVALLSASTFSVPKLPTGKKKGRKPKDKNVSKSKKLNEVDVDEVNEMPDYDEAEAKEKYAEENFNFEDEVEDVEENLVGVSVDEDDDLVAPWES